MAIAARYFDGRTSAARDVEITLFEDGRVGIAGVNVSRSANLSDIRISERIGNTTRRFTLDDGAICEIADNDYVDDWLNHLGAHSTEHRVFRLERRWHYALIALVVTVLGSYAFIRWGLPATADYAARALPRSVDMAIGRGGLRTLDELFFAPTGLSTARQAELRAQFEAMRREMDTGIDLRLELRKGNIIGPNAFALPSGIIVMTDELVQMSKHPAEIESVLAHEVGHIVHRHSLRMLLQSSASALLMITLLGDVSSASTLAASIPTVLVQAKHSRDFEREADSYSRAWLTKKGISLHHFGDLLERIEKEHHGGDGDDDGVMSYFSSHPSNRERSRE